MTVKFVKTKGPVSLENGASLWLPANVIEGLVNYGIPDIYAEDAVQKYPLGAKLEFADGRVFRYGKWGATSTSVPMARMVVNANAQPSATGYVGDDGFEGNLYADAPAGQEYVDLWTILGVSGTGYRAVANPFTENFFEDGMLAVYPAIGNYEYRICGSEATVTPYTRVYLDAPLKEALVVGTAGAKVTDGVLTGSVGGTGVTAMRSLFSQLKDAVAEGVGYVSAMGVVQTKTFTTDCFGWVQRKGRCIVAPTAYFGDTADERMAQLHSDGCIALKAGHGTHTVGYLTQRTVSGYGDLEVWLQLE